MKHEQETMKIYTKEPKRYRGFHETVKDTCKCVGDREDGADESLKGVMT